MFLYAVRILQFDVGVAAIEQRNLLLLLEATIDIRGDIVSGGF